MQLPVMVPDLVTRFVLSRAQRPAAPVIRQRVRLAVRFKRFTIPVRWAQCAESTCGEGGKLGVGVCLFFLFYSYFRTLLTPRAPKLAYHLSFSPFLSCLWSVSWM